MPLLFLGETEEFLVKEAKKSWWTRIKGKEANSTEKIRTCDLSHQLNVLAGIGEQIRTCDLSHQLSASAPKQKMAQDNFLHLNCTHLGLTHPY